LQTSGHRQAGTQALLWHLPVEAEEKYEQTCYDSQSLGWDCNAESDESKTSNWLQHSEDMLKPVHHRIFSYPPQFICIWLKLTNAIHLGSI